MDGKSNPVRAKRPPTSPEFYDRCLNDRFNDQEARTAARCQRAEIIYFGRCTVELRSIVDACRHAENAISERDLDALRMNLGIIFRHYLEASALRTGISALRRAFSRFSAEIQKLPEL